MLTVRMAAWELEDEGRVLSVGDEIRSWLTFAETEGDCAMDETAQEIEGFAHALDGWAGAATATRPTQIDVSGATLYWQAPQIAEGPVAVVGTVWTNNVDAPDGFPETSGVVRRLRMEWQHCVMDVDGQWRVDRTHYQDVPATYLPAPEAQRLTPEVEADLARRAHEAYEREVSTRRLDPGEPFTVVLSAYATPPPPGTIENRWTGVLIDLDVTDARPE